MNMLDVLYLGDLQPATLNLLERPRFTKHAFQLQDLDYLADPERREGSANWSEMGVFKTTTGLWLSEKLHCEKVLIVTTQSGKSPYFKTLPEVFPKTPFYNVEMKEIRPWDDWMTPTGKIDPKKLPNGYYIAHYNVFLNEPIKKTARTLQEQMPRMRPMAKILSQNNWDMVIVDEAHRMKNPNTQWTMNLKTLRATYKHIMTGTGFINQPLEVWSLLNFLDPDEYPSYWGFRAVMTQDVYRSGKRITIIKPERVELFKRRLRQIGVRRTKHEVFKELPSLYPPKIIEVELNHIQRSMYEQIKYELAALDQNDVPLSSPNVLSALTRLRQIAVATPQVDRTYLDENGKRKYEISLVNPSSKLDALMDVVKELEWDDERKDQLVIFSMFNDTFKLIKERMDKLEISYIHMQAKDGPTERFRKVRDFTDGKAQLFLSTIKLGGEAIDLQDKCSRVCFIDRSWSPADNNQAIARVWRPGQKERVQPIMIEAVDTVDQVVEERLEIKQKWFSRIFGDWSKDR